MKYKFLEIYNLPKLHQKESEILNRQSTPSEIEAVKKRTTTTKIFQNKSSGLDGFTGEFYETFQEELMRLLLKLFQNIQEEGKLPSSFYEATITLTAKPDKNTAK